MTVLINIADLYDPNDPAGRTYRQINAVSPRCEGPMAREEVLSVTRSGIQIVSHIDWTQRQAVLSAKDAELARFMEQASDRPARPRLVTEAPTPLSLPPYLGSFYTTGDRKRA